MNINVDPRELSTPDLVQFLHDLHTLPYIHPDNVAMVDELKQECIAEIVWRLIMGAT